MVRLADRPYMIIDVYYGRQATAQRQNEFSQERAILKKCMETRDYNLPNGAPK